MDWTNILEGTIGSLFAFLISTIFVYTFNKYIGKKKHKDKSADEESKIITVSFLKNPFLISLFITSFLFIIAFFSFVYSWPINISSYLSAMSLIFGILTYLIYNNQCPKCKTTMNPDDEISS